MPGFFVSNQKVCFPMKDIFQNRCISSEISHAQYTVMRNTLDKFMDDKLFAETEDYIIITEGVFLNKTKLCNEHGKAWLQTVEEMIAAEEKYFDLFRGSFSGAHYDKAADIWYAYTDNCGGSPVFYYCKDGVWMIASSMEYITDALKALHIVYTPDEDAVYDMATYGFMASDRTYVQDIKKLPYGCYLKADHSGIACYRYYDFHYKSGDSDLSDDEIVERLDALFREAVRAQFDKDDEYGYRHIATLSGGLDSRMVNWVASELGYRDILNITFGQSNCLDLQCAQMVSKSLRTELMIRTLDDGNFLTNYRKIIRMNNGLSIYSGTCHTDIAICHFDHEKLGILHTGDVGDAVVGTFLGKNLDDALPGCYSNMLAERVRDVWDGKEYLEKYKMRTRAFNGVGASMWATGNYMPTMSPFLYRDFFDFCLSQIPESKRAGHYIYKKWLLSKYPKAARIPSARYYGGRLTEGKLLQSLRKAKEKGAHACFDYALVKLHLKKERDWHMKQGGMYPADKWYEENEPMRKDLDSYSEETLKQLRREGICSETVCVDLEKLYSFGTTVEKTLAITALSAMELFFF